MPLSLKQIAANTASVTINEGTDTVTIVYYPARITEKTLAQLQSISTATNMIDGFASFNAVLANVIKSWDLYEDDGQTIMFPLNPERLGELPLFFRVRVIQAIASDFRPEMVAPQKS